ncbi:MAG: hypothetical protein ACHQ53_06580 [Polyangiales bacterium]
MRKPPRKKRSFVLSVAASASALASGCVEGHQAVEAPGTTGSGDAGMVTQPPPGVVARPPDAGTFHGMVVTTGVVPIPSGTGGAPGVMMVPTLDAGRAVDAGVVHPPGVVPRPPDCDAGLPLFPPVHGVIIRLPDAGGCKDAG